jgi:membrane protease YdiL (CAAX protease family)
MTSAPVAFPASPRPGRSLDVQAWTPPAALLAGLGALVAARWWATRGGFDPLLVGAAFGVGLVALSLAMRPARSSAITPGIPEGLLVRLAIGAAAGVVLVAIVVAASAISGRPLVSGVMRPAAPFPSWAAITMVVASAEEILLRGRAFDAVRRAGGAPAAILITTVAFALMHVPLYGWHVVPLDLAVGLGFAGLRLATCGVAAPAAAHAVADLATWWL